MCLFFEGGGRGEIISGVNSPSSPTNTINSQKKLFFLGKHLKIIPINFKKGRVYLAPPPNTINEYFNPILLGLIHYFCPEGCALCPKNAKISGTHLIE